MWWAPTPGAQGPSRNQSNQSKSKLGRSQSVGCHPVLQGSGSLPPCEKRRPRGDGSAPWQKPAGMQIGQKKSPGLPRLPSRGSSRTSTPKSAGSNGVEVLRIGDWSVRRKAPEQGPIFVNIKTGQVQTEPPQDVLEELACDHDGDDLVETQAGEMVGNESARANETEDDVRSTTLETEDSNRPSTSISSSATTPRKCEGYMRFRRIVLGSHNDVPLTMARDILDALREDTALFGEIQQRFSDAPSEPILELRPGAHGRPASPLATPGAKPLPLLPQCLEELAQRLAPGELSDVIGTDSGMQILLRIS